MAGTGAWVRAGNVGLLTDLYQLTMIQAYWKEGLDDEAVFTLYYRTLPEYRNYLLAVGLDTALDYLENLALDSDSLDYLRRRDEFEPAFVDWLGELTFEGDVRALPEGTPVFPEEPILEVRAPLPVAQLAETFIMNQVHLQTVLASKAARVVTAAAGRPVVDFGLRRMHGADAGLKGARAFHIAGVAATSNVLAGRVWDVPVTGTMAHSYIQAHPSELDAFRAFVDTYPETILLVDTYDTLEGVRNVVRLAEELGDDFRVRGVRLDSGDLAELASSARGILDEAGLEGVEIFVSGGLDELAIQDLLDQGAPVDGFGVGTYMGTSRDAPALDMAYKLTEYSDRGRLKLSSGKRILPGPKQVWREREAGKTIRDTITTADEEAPGTPLLELVMEDGERTGAGRDGLDDARDRAAEAIASLPDRIRSLEPADPAYPVEVSDALRQKQEQVARAVQS